MKKVLVVGAAGMLGYAVSEYFKKSKYEVRTISRNEYDIASDRFDKFIPYTKGIDFIVNCAGIIKPRITSNSVESVIRVNGVFPRNLALLSDKKMHCYHITTDCVYLGSKGLYTELDYFDADDVYGLSKNAGDITTLMTLRTSIIGEEQGKGRSLLSWAISQRGKEVNGFTNHLWNGVTTLCLADVIKQIEEKELFKLGIFHIYSPQIVTKLELISLINDIYHLDLKIVPKEAPLKCDRSLSSVNGLSGNLVIKSIKQQLEEMQKFFNKKQP